MQDFLPIPATFQDPQLYFKSLIEFTSESFFRTLVGGVHILDFFTQDPDLYESILSEEWRTYFQKKSIEDILELLLRTPLEGLTDQYDAELPHDLLEFVRKVKGHELRRNVEVSHDGCKQNVAKLKRGLTAGMTEKKVHEVEHFTSYLTSLLSDIKSSNEEISHGLSHLVDFGSGLSYLSRALASAPNNLDVVAIESKKSNIEAGKLLDIRTKLTAAPLHEEAAKIKADQTSSNEQYDRDAKGSILYVEKLLSDGNMSSVLESIENQYSTLKTPSETYGMNEVEARKTPELMIISLHSCGNLIHHALRALLQTKEVKAVAVVGCCYNLMTEKIGQTFKPPYRNSEGLEAKDIRATAADPDGFPLSRLFTSQSVNFNITARMMACQAPYNWTPTTSADFFQRHFYRALLQRIFLDRDVLSTSEPVIIGSLRKRCYTSFYEYAKGAIDKIMRADFVRESIKNRIRDGGLLEIDRKMIEGYEERYKLGRKNLSIVWSLMAFCAGCVESVIIVDRWLFLKESGLVRAARVEAVFDYNISPRNLAVVGIK